MFAPRPNIVTKAENDSYLKGIELHYHGQVGESGSHCGGLGGSSVCLNKTKEKQPALLAWGNHSEISLGLKESISLGIHIGT